jgi:hypothetical protein
LPQLLHNFTNTHLCIFCFYKELNAQTELLFFCSFEIIQ